jgi:hypothetical protein
MTLRQRLWILAVLIGLAVAVPYDLTRSRIPFYRFWGVDFQNLYAFHHCALQNEPYDNPRAAEICQDAERRPMRYPPALYWSFVWTRAFSYAVALRMWVVFILVGTYLGITLFLPAIALARRSTQLFIGLLFVQFPALYALERGNNDVWIVLLWGLSYLAFQRERRFLAGMLAGVTVVAKVYPAFAALVVTMALIRDRRVVVRFVSGAAISAIAVCLLFARSTLTYVSVLGQWASELPVPAVDSHGLPAFFSPLGVVLLGGALLLAWSAAGNAMHRAGQDEVVFAGGLAIATYFSTTSNDYNLITTYPLLAVLFARSMEERRPLTRIALALLLAALFLPRIWFVPVPYQHLALQILALLTAAVAAIREGATAPPATPAPEAH